MSLSPSSQFPTNLDSFPDPTSTTFEDAVGFEHDLLHQLHNDSLEKLQIKVGANSSAVTTTHDYKLSGVTGSDKAVSKTGTETLTNKTLTSPTINTPTISSPTITSPTIALANTSPTIIGSIGYDQTGLDLQVGDGSNSQAIHIGAWTAFTPALTNVTLGSGTVEGFYSLSGKSCIYRIYLVLAADSSIGGAISLGLPLTAATYTGTGVVGFGRIRDVSAGDGYDAIHFSNGAVQAKDSSGTYLKNVATSSTVPMTWATTDYINMTGKYEIA